MGKEKKQFPLDSKANCCIYLCRIISSCELCMDKFKRYNAQTKSEIEKYDHSEVISYDTYGELCDKTYNVMSYLLNLLGDGQTSPADPKENSPREGRHTADCAHSRGIRVDVRVQQNAKLVKSCSGIAAYRRNGYGQGRKNARFDESRRNNPL